MIFNQIDVDIINDYLTYIQIYKANENYRVISSCSIKRKLESLRSLYKYLYINKMIAALVTEFIEIPRIHHDKNATLTTNDIEELERVVIDRHNQSDLQKIKYHSKTVLRDYALLSLILYAGLRSTECVQLNINDIDLNLSMITLYSNKKKVHRIPITQEVVECLKSYMTYRLKQKALFGHENALFLSLQRKRMNVRSLQLLISKYTAEVQLMNPMQLRKVFSNNLYTETNDINLVTNLLGNTDIYHTMKYTIN